MRRELRFMMFHAAAANSGSNATPSSAAAAAATSAFHSLGSNRSASSPSSLLMAGGQILPVLSKFIIRQQEFTKIAQGLLRAVHIGDLLFLSFLGWFTVPLFGCLYWRVCNCSSSAASTKKIKPYTESYLYQVADHISQAARLAILVYLVDCLVIVLDALGFTLSHLETVSIGFAKLIYIGWAAQRLSVFKRYLLGQAVSRKSNKLGRVAMIDRLVDGIITVCTGLFILDILDVEMGIGVTSVFAFGSAGTLIVGLATKDVASMFVSGLALSTSDRFQEGDSIAFGDGTSGVVEKIGWMQTTIRHYDETIAVVPNSALGMQRVKNLSRVKKCRVRQNLRFRYEDAEKLPQLCIDIIEEIKKSCPESITDGSRPFRAVWTDFREDFLQVLVDVHFNLPCLGKKYLENQQRVLLAIHRAVKNNEVEFVTTFYPPGINKRK